jgi:hypothetical protein
MTGQAHPDDPRGLIREAYRMDLDERDCRTVFLDWALGQKTAAGPDQIRRLLDTYQTVYPDHPMTAVLREGLIEPTSRPVRRGGARSRPRS